MSDIDIVVDWIVKLIKSVNSGKVSIGNGNESIIDMSINNSTNRIDIDILKPEVIRFFVSGINSQSKGNTSKEKVQDNTETFHKIKDTLYTIMGFVEKLFEKGQTKEFENLDILKEFAQMLTNNNMTISLLRKGKEAIIMGKEANPTVSKVISKSNDLQIKNIQEVSKLISDWIAKRHVISTDNLDLGYIEEIRDTYIMIQTGLIKKKRYYIPKSSIESYDGSNLNLLLNKDNIESYEDKGKVDSQFEDYPAFKSSDMSKVLETTIPVISENLEVTKKVIEEEIKIIKKPIKETKAVEIEFVHEKIVIEKRSSNISSISTQASEQIKSSITELPMEHKIKISIPLKREVPIITKKIYLNEEITISKKAFTETKTITENIIHEKAYYNVRD